MSEPNVPPPHKVPAKAGKSLVGSLKGHPPWVYAVVIAGAVAMAYIIRKRQAAAAAAATVTGPDGAPTAVDGYATAGYDTSAYPAGTQGAGGYVPGYVPGSEVPASTYPALTPPDMISIFQQIWDMQHPVGGGGGGAPTVDPNAHYAPTPDVSPQPDVGPVYQPPPPPPATQAPPKAVASGPQPTMGPGIFYNPDRKLRYIVQATKGNNYRRYESKLNKGDWGKTPGSVIPQ